MGKSLRVPASDRDRLSDSVYQTLLEEVLSGRLPPGKVVSEVALAKEHEVSRTPVHDALRQLAKDGLVEQRAGRRAVIASFAPDDVYDIFEMRKLLECEAARRAAGRLSRPELVRLRATADQLAKSRKRPDWHDRWAEFDEDFHGTIARAAGSPRLTQDIIRYRLMHRGFNKLANVEALQQAVEEHLRILEALEKRNGEAAQKAMVAHIQEWQAYFVNHIPR